MRAVKTFLSISTSTATGMLAAGLALFSGTVSAETSTSSNVPAKLPFEVTEERVRCANYDPLKQPFFGDLHVHTSYSFDSFVSSQRNTPWDAYRYAKGEAITLPDERGEQKIIAKIQRPLDFTAVTDHAEFLGQINVCADDPSEPGYWFPYCMMTRSNTYPIQLLAADYWQGLGVSGTSANKEKSFACTLSDCDAGQAKYWNNIQQAAEDHYDRTEACSFTTMVGYEYTDAPEFKNMHRNVIFRNDRVVEKTISTYETGSYNYPDLWKKLRKDCTDKGTGCDVISIPHNPNLSGGLMFRDPLNEEERDNRIYFEPLVELVQHKAASECRYDRLAGRGVQTQDELCDFEQTVADNLSMLGTVYGKVMAEGAKPVPVDEFAPRNMVRNALKDGLKLGQEDGVNPFKMGFIGSTDTHSATPGGAEEDNFTGHLGKRDSGYRNVQDHFFDNPGGHAVVWAEENSRDSLFNAMRQREAYATSGTRPIVRFFAGWDFKPEMCNAFDLVKQGYERGVAMGGDMTSRPGNEAPTLLVTAMKDPGIFGHPGTDLQRIQIIKGWVDKNGKTHEKVIDMAGNPDNGATVNKKTCEPEGQGYASLCGVWKDPEFNPEQPAFYYARVVENPSCRWSTLQCKSYGVDPFSPNCEQQAATQTENMDDMGDIFGRCCIDPKNEPFYSPTIQERAWTSPVWYTPEDKQSSIKTASIER
ncbi:hypothetical protein GZ78_16070 [Endozoicomonas numazuensis]|uniref:DUF3604 domain-containing protein n=1 Tax=Endozoicomonas numazuensis TaxID=1137799 RepID=A0A081NFV3_9GAMM|nr:hypothetical protein GZ78_16070 [Endozoicomonas numazuensis]